MNEFLVSISMLAYNHEAFIARAIESVIMQKTNFPYQLVISDDCSTDKTREICNMYKNRFPDKIKLILHDKNLGATKNAINNLENCTGKYTAVCEGDDFWTDEYKLQAQVEFMEKNPQFSMCFTNSVIVDSAGKVIKDSRVPDEKKKNISQKEILEGFCPPTNTILFKSEYFRTLPVEYTQVVNGDFFLSIYFTEYGDAGYINRNTAAYRMHSNSGWSSKPEFYQMLQYRHTCKVLLKLYRHKYEALLQSLINNASARMLELAKQDDFLDNGFWTPQSKMLQVLRDVILSINDPLQNGLSIDENPTIEKMLKAKNPDLELRKASYPEYDAQNLHQFKDNTFDVVFSHQVLEHIPKPWIAAKEMMRVLKKGGIGIHSSCAFNPRHGLPEFNDYYRFLPDGLEQLFDGIETIHKGEWGSRQAVLYNVGIDDGNGALGGRRFHRKIGELSDGLYPWHTWIIFRKK